MKKLIPEEKQNDVFISIIVPAYNEEKSLGLTIEKIVHYLNKQNYTWELIIVDDGSTDNTVNIAKDKKSKTHKSNIQIIELSHAGKGWAIKNGMLRSNGSLKFMCDADLSMPIENLQNFIINFDSKSEIIIGSRELKSSQRHGESIFRKLRSKIFNSIVRILLPIPFKDTQCGFKCFKKDTAEKLFNLQQIKGFSFDVEILYLANKFGIKTTEMPIAWEHKNQSQINSIRDSLKMLLDVLKIRITH